jgi:hypothetical protein
MATIVNVWQLNTNRAPMALNTLLNEQFQKYNIALLQEPPLSKNSLIKIPHPFNALAAPNNPRTAIIFNPSLDILAIPHLSDTVK